MIVGMDIRLLILEENIKKEYLCSALLQDLKNS